MLSNFRLAVFVLALPFLAGGAAELAPGANPAVTPLYAKLSLAPAKLGAAHGKLSVLQVRPVSAELEDGPEGEEAPLAILVRAYDGDDQIEASLDFSVIAAGFLALSPSLKRTPPAPSHRACAGLPTGPPAV